MFLEAESPAAAPFMDDFSGWRSSGIRVTQCFTAKTNENPVNVEVSFAPLSAIVGIAGASLLVVVGVGMVGAPLLVGMAVLLLLCCCFAAALLLFWCCLCVFVSSF